MTVISGLYQFGRFFSWTSYILFTAIVVGTLALVFASIAGHAYCWLFGFNVFCCTGCFVLFLLLLCLVPYWLKFMVYRRSNDEDKAAKLFDAFIESVPTASKVPGDFAAKINKAFISDATR